MKRIPDRYRVALTAALALSMLSTSACIATARSRPYTPSLLAPKDSSAMIYEAGRQDAAQLNREPSATMISALAPVASVVVMQASRSPTAGIATIVGVQVGVTGWQYSRTKVEAPPPADSMRTHYGLVADARWDQYVRGYKSWIEENRQLSWENQKTRTLLSTAMLVALFAAIPRR